MSTKEKSQWRTVIVAIVGCVLLLVAFVVMLALAKEHAPTGEGVKLFEGLKDGIEVLIIAVAFKSGVEYLGGGGGLRGAARALLTEAAPAGPAAPPPGPPVAP